MPGKCAYKKEWEKEFPWISPVKNDKTSAFCGICVKSFKFDNSGISQIKSHAKSHESKKQSVLNWQNQRKFESSANGIAALSSAPKNSITLSEKDQVLRAEILQALHMVNKNISFASAADDNERFRIMFPDSAIAKAYRQADSKVQYVVKYGIALDVKKNLIEDAKETPYSFLFDETTNSQVKKQYDAYIVYFSKRSNRITHSYCGSLFIGHCNADDLVDHYFEFVKQLQLDSNFLLHLGMDGPNVNLSFEKKLAAKLQEINTSFLKIGSCSLHPVHGAFEKGVKAFYVGVVPLTEKEKAAMAADKEKTIKPKTFDMDDFFQDIHFFFKLSSARREDYASLSEVTGVVAWYAMRHAETRWVSMKYVAVRVLEQWANLEEYFLKYLPKQSNFKKDIANTQRYNRLKTAFKDPTMPAYVGFIIFVGQDFENFLIPFQGKEPMIHHLYPAMTSLLYEVMRKFIKTSKLNADDLSQNITIDVNKDKNLKSLKHIDVGCKAKTMFSKNSFLITDQEQEKFRSKCLKFYQVAVEKLQLKLPLDIPFLKDIQYINPVKRLHAGATSAISNVALKVVGVLENVIEIVFGVQATKDEIVDKVRSQWILFQNEDIKNEWFIKSEEPSPSVSRKQESYWEYAQIECGLDPSTPSPFSKYKPIDEFWRRVGDIVDEFGAKKYQQLVALVLAALSLSHGNSTPERGFSINKILLAVHGPRTYEDTIIALRMVKDEINRVGGTCKFPITRSLLDSVKEASAKSEIVRIAKQKVKEAQEKLCKQKEEEKRASEEADKQISAIDDQMDNCKTNITVANDLIITAQDTIQKAVNAKQPSVAKQLTQQGLSQLQIGNDRKRKFEEDLEALTKKKMRLLKKK